VRALSSLTHRNFLIFSGLIAFVCLAFAFTAQYIDNITPCVLCLYERYFYAAIIFAGFIGYTNLYPRPTFWLLGLVLAGGAILGFYHLGVERHWWQGTAACHGVATQAKTVQELKALLQAKPLARCDQANWILFGISATYLNLGWFLGFLGLWSLAQRLNK
jgi:disulfide bond formation protein DsbB